MIQSVISLIENGVDEKILVLIVLAFVVIMFICGVVAILTLDRDNDEMRIILDGLLKEKQAAEEEKKACQK